MKADWSWLLWCDVAHSLMRGIRSPDRAEILVAMDMLDEQGLLVRHSLRSPTKGTFVHVSHAMLERIAPLAFVNFPSVRPCPHCKWQPDLLDEIEALSLAGLRTVMDLRAALPAFANEGLPSRVVYERHLGRQGRFVWERRPLEERFYSRLLCEAERRRVVQHAQELGLLDAPDILAEPWQLADDGFIVDGLPAGADLREAVVVSTEYDPTGERHRRSRVRVAIKRDLWLSWLAGQREAAPSEWEAAKSLLWDIVDDRSNGRPLRQLQR